MPWWVVTVPLDVVGQGDGDVLAARLWSLGATGVAEHLAGGRPVLSAGFPDGDGARSAADALGPPAEAAPADDRGWVDAWRLASTPTRVGGLVVRAPWHPAEPDADIEVVIDPGPTFGHGGHATTRLVLAALPPLVRPGTSVLDVGSGSGVLAVAAAALGAGPVVAVDTDPDAVAATRSNAAANGVEVQVVAGTATAELGRFDVVLANLLAPTLRELAPALLAVTATGGALLVAGLLTEQRAGVEAALAPLRPRAEHRDGDWLALELARP